jgi:hypothetical protein
MINDPIVLEVRKARKEIEAECRNDWELLYKRVLNAQNKHKKRLISLKPRKLDNYKSVA